MVMKKLIITAIICLTPSMSFARMLPDDDVLSVIERERKTLDPLGIPVRTFLFHPGMNVNVHYDDNIFRSRTNEQSDLITIINPTAELVSNWNIHELRIYADADLARYADNDDENYEDFRIGARGRYDLTHGTYLYGGLQFDETHEGRDSPDDVSGDEPTELDIWSGKVGFARDLAKLKLFVEGRLRDIEYDNATANGAAIDNSFRNRTQYEADAKLAYELSPNYELFIRGIYDEREYDNNATATDRSSDGWRVEFGTDINVSGKVKAQIHGGYITRDYDTAFKDVNTVDYGAALTWNLNGLTSLVGDLDRRVIETTQSNVSSYIRTRGTVGLEHAFAENILGEAKLTYTNDDFVGGIREDDILGGKIGLTYKPMRGAELGLVYDYTDRNSTQNISDYQNHRLLFHLGYKF